MSSIDKNRKLKYQIVISKLKSGKNLGFDNISKYMTKCGQIVLLPSVFKLFKGCLTFGHYPKLWSSRYITPIHKSNDISDLNNNRGISVT